MTSTHLLSSYPYRIILGSASPRRQQLLGDLGFTFTVEVPELDEGTWPRELKEHQIPLYLAEQKSAAFQRALADDELLITADTIVWHNGRVYNKPADEGEALKMLGSLSANIHYVYTGVCIRGKFGKRVFYSESKVFFAELTQDEKLYYVRNYRPYDKAGSYGVQDWLGYTGIERIEGSFYNIMGLPVRELYVELIRIAREK